VISTPFDLVIVGAGISGLTLARLSAQAGLRVLLLESSPTVGGAIRSARTSDGYWYELGAHTLYNSYGALIGHLESAGLMDKIQRRAKAPYRLLVDGKVRSVPSQINKGELFASVWKAFTARKAGKSVSEYYGSLVGRKNWKQVFSALFSAVPSQRADNFPAEMLFKKRERRKDLPRTFTLTGGLSTLVEALAKHPNLEVRTEAPVLAIEKCGDGFNVQPQFGEPIHATRVAVAVPADGAATLLGSVLPDIAAVLGNLRTATIASTGVVLRKEDLWLPTVAGLFPLSEDFFSIVSRDVVPHDRYRAASFHFKGETDRESRLANIARVLRTTPDRFVHLADNLTTLPSPILGHADQVARLDAALQTSGIFLTGNYFGGLAIEDCALRSQYEFNRLINERK